MCLTTVCNYCKKEETLECDEKERNNHCYNFMKLTVPCVECEKKS